MWSLSAKIYGRFLVFTVTFPHIGFVIAKQHGLLGLFYALLSLRRRAVPFFVLLNSLSSYDHYFFTDKQFLRAKRIFTFNSVCVYVFYSLKLKEAAQTHETSVERPGCLLLSTPGLSSPNKSSLQGT